MTRKQKKHLARIIAAAVLLALVWFVLPLEGIWKLLAYCVPYFIVGWDVLWGAIRKILHGDLMDEEFLMSVATIGAFVLGDYREAVAVMLFYQIGEWFQGVAVGKTRRNITQLMDLRPDYANVVRNGQEEKVDPDEVEVGETIIVRPGEKIPLDGVILEGSTAVDTAALTGESLPQDKAEGNPVVSGTVNLTGVITVQTQSAYGESTAAKILELVENAADQKARVESPLVHPLRRGRRRPAGGHSAPVLLPALGHLGGACPGIPGRFLPLRAGCQRTAHLLRRYRRGFPLRHPGKGRRLYGNAG